SPTTKSPRYVVESDLEEDPEEYEDDETEDGPVDYPMDGGEGRDDDDGDSSGDDADDEDEEDEEEEEHLAPADSAVIVPTVELVSPPEGIEPASISLPPEAKVERLIAMPTPPPSILTSLSPPSTRECLAWIASTQAFVDAITAALSSPPLPPLPLSLYIPPPVDRMDDVPESEQPPRKRSCLFALGSSTLDAEEGRRGIREVGYGIRDTWVDPAEVVPEIAPMTMGEVNTRVTELVELHEHDTHDLYALLEDAQDSRTRISQREEAYASREAWAHSIGLSQIIHHELQTQHDHVYAHETQIQAYQTQLQLQDMRREMSDMQAKLLALREQQRRARQPGPDVRVPYHQDASRDADSHI
ncbi:hypothetical protein Tco_1481641, partial [Tanacetum coccineum]